MRRQISQEAGFLWGASTSAHQVEGNNIHSDWWHLETMEHSPLKAQSGHACDSYDRWADDMDLLAAAGLNAYRFSIEWARIQPAPISFNLKEVDHYQEMIDGARERGLLPIVTLHHFTLPAWFAASGGWLRPDAAERFLAYVDVLLPLLEKAEAVVTINEPNMVAVMHRVISGEASLETGLGGGLPKPSTAVTDVLIDVHHQTRAFLHENLPELPVGWSVANQVVRSVPGGEQYAAEYKGAIEDVFVAAAADDDFLGVQAYTRTVFDADGAKVVDPAAPLTQTGWEYYPKAVGEAVRDVRELVPDVPLLITENGIATADDQQRIAYTDEALASLEEQADQGAQLLGYLHWSLLDNYEWGSWDPTFGLVAVDREHDFLRSAKPSLAWLGQQNHRAAQLSATTPTAAHHTLSSTERDDS